LTFRPTLADGLALSDYFIMLYRASQSVKKKRTRNMHRTKNISSTFQAAFFVSLTRVRKTGSALDGLLPKP
jgi:hypothetical protein